MIGRRKRDILGDDVRALSCDNKKRNAECKKATTRSQKAINKSAI